MSSRSHTAVAYFQSTKNIYPKDRVKLLGVDIGRIESITPEPGRVRVEISYRSKYTLPADVRAGIVAPTLVATRYVDLGPAYTGSGPTLADGATIPLTRTAVPMEFDDLKQQIADLTRAFGPGPDGKQGMLSKFVDVAAANARGGRGTQFNQMIQQAAAAAQTLSNGRDDIFGTIRNLDSFVAGLNAVDQQVVEFNQNLASVSGVLEDNRKDFSDAIEGVSQASIAVNDLLKDNTKPLTESVDQLGQLTKALAAQRDVLAQILHVGPNTLMNFVHIFNPRSGALTGQLIVNQLNTPADFACSAMASAAAMNTTDATKACTSYLGPLMNLLRVQQAPIGENLVAVPGGGAPTEPPGEREKPGANNQYPDQHLPPDTKVPGLGGLVIPPGGN
jgi:phospholipid/cholesterol/gamma-HCH transport system substrate-binding protein